MAITNVTTATFNEEVLASEKPVLVDFWAVWCGPCKMMAPVLEIIDEDMPEVKICKVNVDENMDLAMQYSIQSIPAMYVFKNGQVAKKIIGYTPEDELKEALAEI